MIFRDKHEKSVLPKLFIATTVLFSILLSAYLIFGKPQVMIKWLIPYRIEGDGTRLILLLSCFFIYFFRLLGTLFVFFQRIGSAADKCQIDIPG